MFGFHFTASPSPEQVPEKQASPPKMNPQSAGKTQLPAEFYVLVEHDRNSKAMKVIKISPDKETFFDFPPDCQQIDQHFYVTEHSQFKAFVTWINNNQPLKKERYVRNLKFSVLDKEGNRTPESLFYINSTGQWRMKIGSVQHFATAERIYRDEDSMINLNANYSGRELLKQFGKLIVHSMHRIGFVAIFSNFYSVANLNCFPTDSMEEDDSNSLNTNTSSSRMMPPLNLLVRQKRVEPEENSSNAKRTCTLSVSVFNDLLSLKSKIPKFDMFQHEPSEWVSTVKRAVEGYQQPNEIMKYLHSFMLQKSMVEWFVKSRMGTAELDAFRGHLEKETTVKLLECHTLADLHLDEFLTKIKYDGSDKIQEFFKRKLLLFSDLYPTFTKEKAHEKMFYQLGAKFVSEFLPYRKDTLEVIMQVAKIYDQLKG